MKSRMVLAAMAAGAAGAMAGWLGHGEKPKPGLHAYQAALENYTCTVEQMRRVEDEARGCHENGFRRPYCYGTAIMRNCKQRRRWP